MRLSGKTHQEEAHEDSKKVPEQDAKIIVASIDSGIVARQRSRLDIIKKASKIALREQN